MPGGGSLASGGGLVARCLHLSPIRLACRGPPLNLLGPELASLPGSSNGRHRAGTSRSGVRCSPCLRTLPHQGSTINGFGEVPKQKKTLPGSGSHRAIKPYRRAEYTARRPPARPCPPPAACPPLAARPAARLARSCPPGWGGWTGKGQGSILAAPEIPLLGASVAS
jgi:hypothetical protein